MAGEKRFSYIRYPFAKNGWFSIALAVVSLIATAVVLAFSIANRGSTSLFWAACGFTALAMSIMGLWFAFLALGEREKNYLFAFIGGGISLVLAVAWVIIIFTGNK